MQSLFRVISWLVLASTALLVACGGGGGGGTPATSGGPTYAVNVTVSGLDTNSTELVLQNNAADDLSINADGTYAFNTQIEDGQAYSVTVLSQPTAPNQICSVSNPNGNINGAAVSNIVVTCHTSAFALNFTVNNLSGTGLVVANNLGDAVDVSADGNYTFPQSVADGTGYNVFVAQQPAGPDQICTVSNSTGQFNGSDISNVVIDCVTNQVNTYSVGGNVTGLAGTGLVLQNGNDIVTISGNGSFTFPATVMDGDTYAVTVASAPDNPSQTCVVANASGTIQSANVSNVAVTCTIDQFTLSGSISGLLGSGLTLIENQTGETLAIDADGVFAFSGSYPDTSSFDVRVQNAPTSPDQNCTVTNGSGQFSGSDISNIEVICSTTSYQLGGNVSGLVAGGSLTLQTNAGEQLTITANGSYSFNQTYADTANYSVTILSLPTNPSQACTVSNANGQVNGSDVLNIDVSCSTQQYRIGGNVSGLSGSGLTLIDNASGDTVAISSNGIFSFANTYLDQSAYDVSVMTQPTSPSQTCTVVNGAGQLSGQHVQTIEVTCSVQTYTISGSVSGLSGSGLVLRNNANEELVINSNGSFIFSTNYADQAYYGVVVATQPSSPDQTCTVTDGFGQVAAADVKNISVSCVTNPPNTYRIGGLVNGLGIDTVNLSVSIGGSSQRLVVSGDGPFVYPNPVNDGETYTVQIAVQPQKYICKVTNASGTVSGNHITDIRINCIAQFFDLSARVINLVGDGLTINEVSQPNIVVTAGTENINFGTYRNGDEFTLTIVQQPSSPAQICRFIDPANGNSYFGSITGTFGFANKTISILCVTQTFKLNVAISGLNGPSLSMQVNGQSDQYISAPGNYELNADIVDGDSYTVGFSYFNNDIDPDPQVQMPKQSCLIRNSEGLINGADVNNIRIDCQAAVRDIYAGGDTTCVILTNGKTKCWGDNGGGQLGQELPAVEDIGDDANEMGDNLPPIDFGTELQQAMVAYELAIGNSFACALVNNPDDLGARKVKCWGSNVGALGFSTQNKIGDDQGEMGDSLPFVNIGAYTPGSITAASLHACQLSTSGELICWGSNISGELGQDNTDYVGDLIAITDINPVFLGATVIDIATGGFANITRRADPSLPDEIQDTRGISCAILESGSLKCWGSNQYGQLGQGHNQDIGVSAGDMANLQAIDLGTVPVLNVPYVVSQVSIGHYHTCALLTSQYLLSNVLKCWGSNSSGQLGQDLDTNTASNRGDNRAEMGDNLRAVDLGSGRYAKQVSNGGFHTCAILDNDQIKCWGSNFAGQLGLGDLEDRGDNPVSPEMGNNLPYVDLGSDYPVIKIATGASHTCALLNTRDVKCWGNNYAGQLGLGDDLDRGDEAGEMGDNLPRVNVGTQ